MVVPAATPKPIIDKLSVELAKILAMPDVRERLTGQGADPFISTPPLFAAMIRAEIAIRKSDQDGQRQARVATCRSAYATVPA